MEYRTMRNRYPTRKQAELQNEALSRAVSSLSLSNYPAIIQGFLDKGIPASDITPRENVFTYHAWRAKGRQVRKGEHGVRVVTWIPVNQKPDESNEIELADDDAPKRQGKRPWSAVVFHVLQTDPAN
jgi:hypothetical protein